MILHKRSLHKGEKFKCPQCDAELGQKFSIINIKHIEAVHEGIKYHYKFCDYKSTTKENLKVHTQAKHASTKFTCSMCDFQATVKGHLKRHKH